MRGLCCAALVLLPLVASSATPIYRSVGPGTTMPLATGSGQLTVSSSLAAFTTALPTKVGVGDVIEYDSNGDGLRDALAFIHARDPVSGGARFTVRSASGAAATPTSAPTLRWAVFRAYTSLDAATRGLENTGIALASRDFDTSSEGRDLVAADEEWNIACYADGEDVTAAALCNSDNPAGLEGCGMTGNHGWRTDATHAVRIYTPVSQAEVGVSQRHTGVWGTGYRISAGLILYAGFIWADGLSLRQPNANGRAYLIRPNGLAGRVWLSNSFGWQTCLSCPNMRVFDASMRCVDALRLPGARRDDASGRDVSQIAGRDHGACCVREGHGSTHGGRRSERRRATIATGSVSSSRSAHCGPFRGVESAAKRRPSRRRVDGRDELLHLREPRAPLRAR